ncbi:MAG: class I tRNA ligase family protein, partial [Saprospiraceae bacterium]|nr:class I tRNA ligase family protein [Saprospiraceae bacterium]
MFKVLKNLNLSEVDKEILQFWEDNKVFEKSVDQRDPENSFVFYEGPPSANGKPGIHHVMARTIKDIFCRFQTMKGKRVERKGGWDTHGLPIELSVEKELGITKEDIGKSITVDEYNQKCRETVMRYKDMWDDITRKMGYWVDLDDPYITYENNYIESVWYLLKRLYDKDLLYKGFTIQPYSPAAGTGLSSHELNMPGAYKEIKDISAIAQFKIKNTDNEYFLAWTTTPWTLPSNTALAVGKNITYVKVKTFNRYTQEPTTVILAKDRLHNYFSEQNPDLKAEDMKPGNKPIPYLEIIGELKGAELEGMEYEQLLPYVQPDKPAFKVLLGDFVSTEDGTGIVHIAPTFGADDFRVAQQYGIPPLMVKDEKGN